MLQELETRRPKVKSDERRCTPVFNMFRSKCNVPLGALMKHLRFCFCKAGAREDLDATPSVLKL